MFARTGGTGVFLSPAGLSGVGGGVPERGVAVALSGEPGWATGFLAKAGAPAARKLATTRRRRLPADFIMGKTLSFRSGKSPPSLHRFLDKPQAPGLMRHLTG